MRDLHLARPTGRQHRQDQSAHRRAVHATLLFSHPAQGLRENPLLRLAIGRQTQDRLARHPCRPERAAARGGTEEAPRRAHPRKHRYRHHPMPQLRQGPPAQHRHHDPSATRTTLMSRPYHRRRSQPPASAGALPLCPPSVSSPFPGPGPHSDPRRSSPLPHATRSSRSSIMPTPHPVDQTQPGKPPINTP
jgi:hypothetical protein